MVRSGKLKRKPFNSNVADYLLTIATFGFSYPRVSSDTPSFTAFTPVAPGVRFNAFDFLLCSGLNASFPRLTAAGTRFGSAVQTKGFGVELVSARKRLIATWRSTRERKTPRLRRRLVSLAKKPSTALSQDAEVGVKWNVQRGCRASHLRGIMAQTPQGAPKVPRAFGVCRSFAFRNPQPAGVR